VTLSIEESESFGLAVIEAAACEVPAVVSNVGGLPEAVEDNVTGFIVESKNIQQAANALIKLITDRKLKNKMGKMGRERVIRDFNWNEKVIEMLNLYRKTISG
jgi:glycosyltransferase involved in cell wall biosynthesis